MPVRRTPFFCSLVACLGAFACSSADPGTADESVSAAVRAPPRNWQAHPAIVEIDDADEIYAVSDVHGHYDMFASLLATNHIIERANADPKKVKWTAGAAILVITGDLIDKGPQSLEAIDFARALQESARRNGGRVVVTMGNHEAEFLADPRNDKATSKGEDETGIDRALDAQGIDPKSLVRGTDREGRGAWMASLPFAVRIKKWFFSHGGNTSRMSVEDLSAKLQHSIDKNGYDDKDITGNDSLLEGQKWYGDPDDKDAGEKEAKALGVEHIVFGHDPGALDDHDRIRASKNGILVKIDTEMGIHNASGVGRAVLLHVTTRGKDTAESLDESGRAKDLL